MPRTPPRRVRPLRRAPYVSQSLAMLLAASYTHRFARSTLQRFSYATFRLRNFSVAVWRGSEGIGFFLALSCRNSRKSVDRCTIWRCFFSTCENKRQWTHAHVEKSFYQFRKDPAEETVDRCTFSRVCVGVFYRAP